MLLTKVPVLCGNFFFFFFLGGTNEKRYHKSSASFLRSDTKIMMKKRVTVPLAHSYHLSALQLSLSLQLPSPRCWSTPVPSLSAPCCPNTWPPMSWVSTYTSLPVSGCTCLLFCLSSRLQDAADGGYFGRCLCVGKGAVISTQGHQAKNRHGRAVVCYLYLVRRVIAS